MLPVFYHNLNFYSLKKKYKARNTIVAGIITRAAGEVAGDETGQLPEAVALETIVRTSAAALSWV